MEKKEEKNRVIIKEKKSTFPKLKIGFSIVIFVLAVVDLLGLSSVSRLVVDILLLISGLWLLESGISSGFNRSHREILKKYI